MDDHQEDQTADATKRQSVKRIAIDGTETVYRTATLARAEMQLSVSKLARLIATGEYDSDGSRYFAVDYVGTERRPLLAFHMDAAMLEKAKSRAQALQKKSLAAYVRDLITADLNA
jgi:hypothetical protein